MALFPQFPYSDLHELNLDWLINNISQLVEDGTVISVNGMSGRVTLYTEKDVELPPRAFDANWSVYRRIADKMAGLQFTGEKFFYITKNVSDEDFTIQEVFTSANPPPYPVTSVNGRIGTVIIAGDNTPYNMDGVDTIESVVSNIQKAIGPVVQYTSCSVGVTAGQYVYLFMSGISGRTDGIYKAANNKSANTAWTAADLIPASAGIGGLLANDENSINALITKTNYKTIQDSVFSQLNEFGIKTEAGLSSYPTTAGLYRVTQQITGLPSGARYYGALLILDAGTYWVHIYISTRNDFYYSCMTTSGTPTSWHLVTATEVQPVT